MGKSYGDFFLNLALVACLTGLYAAAPGRRSPSLAVSPSVIILGVTPSLTINCSYPAARSHDLATVTSLTIYSRTNSSAHLHKRGVVQVIGDNGETKILVSKNAEGEGVIKEKGESFLFLMWSFPSGDEAVEYFCVLTGKDVKGAQVQSNAGIRVTSRTPWYIRKIQQLENGYKNLSQRVSNLEKIMDLKTRSSALHRVSLISQPNVEPYKKDT